MRIVSVLLCGLMAFSFSYRAAHAASMITETRAGASEPSARFTISGQTQVPGATLPPGSYTIHVLDHLSDRMIVEIDGASGGTRTTFIGVTNASLPKPAAAGMISYNAGSAGKSALRGFSFSNGTVVEFVYPKAEAAALAQVNAEKVPAIDPESEGRVAAADLSKSDMQLVTLWMLSTTRVGSGEPGVKAERFKQAAAVRPPRPVLASLPHTASELPVVWMTALFSLTGAGLLRLRRLRATRSA